MSGAGAIIEKVPFRFPEQAEDCVRYRVMDPRNQHDETFVCAEPADDEPALGETIWWGGGKDIYWGPNDSKRLNKVGYSWSPDR
jgi:hypothetical protein